MLKEQELKALGIKDDEMEAIREELPSEPMKLDPSSSESVATDPQDESHLELNANDREMAEASPEAKRNCQSFAVVKSENKDELCSHTEATNNNIPDESDSEAAEEAYHTLSQDVRFKEYSFIKYNGLLKNKFYRFLEATKWRRTVATVAASSTSRRSARRPSAWRSPTERTTSRPCLSCSRPTSSRWRCRILSATSAAAARSKSTQRATRSWCRCPSASSSASSASSTTRDSSAQSKSPLMFRLMTKFRCIIICIICLRFGKKIKYHVIFLNFLSETLLSYLKFF